MTECEFKKSIFKSYQIIEFNYTINISNRCFSVGLADQKIINIFETKTKEEMKFFDSCINKSDITGRNLRGAYVTFSNYHVQFFIIEQYFESLSNVSDPFYLLKSDQVMSYVII